MTEKITDILKLIIKSKFFFNVILLAGSTSIAQGIVVLFSPILTRLYSPDDFGILTTYTSILSMLLVVVSGKYELAITLPENNNVAVNLLILAFIILFVMSACLAVVLLLFGDSLLQIIDMKNLLPYMFFLPLGVFGAGTYQILNYWCIRQKDFYSIARTRLNQSFAQVITQLVFGLSQYGASGLIIGDIIGRFGGSSTLAKITWKKYKTYIESIKIFWIKEVAYLYKKFPIYSVPSGLLNSAGLQLPFLLIVSYYGLTVGGWIALIQRVIGIPMSLIGWSVAQVYYAEASQLMRKSLSQMYKLFKYTLLKLLFIGIAPFTVLFLSGPWLIENIFGSAWREAGYYLKILAFAYLIQFIVVPLSQTLNLLEKQQWQFIWDLGRLIIVVGGLITAKAMGLSAWYSILIYSFTLSFTYIMLLVLSYIFLRQAMKKDVVNGK